MSKRNKQTKKILNQNWDEIQKRISNGETITAVAQLFGISRQALSARLKKKSGTVHTVANPSARILVMDIETSPFTAYSYNRWQVNISDAMRRDDNITILSFSYKWLGDKEVYYEENRNNCDKDILKKLSKILNEADIVIGHNMQRFDTPMVNTRLVMNGLTPCKPYRIIDTLKIAKKHYRFEKNTLDWVARSLNCSRKLEHKSFPGMSIWIEMLHGNDEAWDENKKYNKQDVVVTEEIYEKMKAFTKPHISVIVGSGSTMKRCPTCGSTSIKPHGHYYTNLSKFQQYQCEDCNSFSRARKNLLSKEARENLLSPVAGI